MKSRTLSVLLAGLWLIAGIVVGLGAVSCLGGCSLDQLTRGERGAQVIVNATTQPSAALAAAATDAFAPGLGTLILGTVGATATLAYTIMNRMKLSTAEGKATELSKANSVLNTLTGALGGVPYTPPTLVVPPTTPPTKPPTT